MPGDGGLIGGNSFGGSDQSFHLDSVSLTCL